MAGMLAKMNVWLPGSQYAAAGSLNVVTSTIDSFVSEGSGEVRILGKR